MIGKRVLSAVVLIPIVVGLVYLGGYPLWVLVLIAALIAGYEFVSLTRHQELRTSLVLTLLIIILYICQAPPLNLDLLQWGVPLIAIFALTVEIGHRNAPGSIQNWALAVAGGIYIGFPVSSVLHLRAMEQGSYWIILALANTWICDTAAYFIGSRWGKHRFFPAISPKKTIEGAIAGVVVGIATTTLSAILVLRLSWWLALSLGIMLVIGATLGDLAESVIKRQFAVKDSSNLIPGHGGMLDRIDSLLYVFPLVYLTASCIKWLAL